MNASAPIVPGGSGDRGGRSGGGDGGGRGGGGDRAGPSGRAGGRGGRAGGRGRRVVVLRALGLGDLLTAVPALRGLRRHRPTDRIVLAAPAWLAEAAALTGAVDELLDTAPLAPLPAAAAGAALAVNLHGRGPRSTELLAATRPRRLVAFGPTALWRADEPERARWCRLLAAAGIPADPEDLALLPPGLAPGAAGATVVHPGAASPARRWPAQRWAAVAAALHAAGHRVVVTGGAAEVGLAAAVATDAGLPDDAVLAGRTGLTALAAVVASARLVLCGDTGVGHLATGYGTPSVLLFGPTPPALWGPPPDRGRHRVLWAGRTGDPHGQQPDPGLLALGVSEVLAAAEEAVALGEPSTGVAERAGQTRPNSRSPASPSPGRM